MWNTKLKTINEQTRQTNKPHRHRPQRGGYQEERVGAVEEVGEGKGDKYTVIKELTLGDKHTMQHTDDFS